MLLSGLIKRPLSFSEQLRNWLRCHSAPTSSNRPSGEVQGAVRQGADAQTAELLADMFASDALLRQIMTAEITLDKAIVNLYQP